MIVRNPILTGCCPDPSVCRVGEDYYLVNSTFEFFPGVPIYHSKDLVNWEQIGHCISREEQLQFAKGRLNSTGIFAPTIRYNNGIFYMVTTNMNDQGIASGNFFMWAENPAGPWSNAIFLDLEGIDPSFYFEENRAYYTGTSEAGIYIQEVDLDKGVPVGESKVLWPGTGGAYPEGPHIYKKGDWYYLNVCRWSVRQQYQYCCFPPISIPRVCISIPQYYPWRCPRQWFHLESDGRCGACQIPIWSL